MTVRRIFVLGLALGLAACGADGPPVAPEPAAATSPGVRVSGDAQIGVVVRNP